MMKKKVIIIGTGGHAKVVADIVLKSGDIIKGFIDKNEKQEKFIGYPILGNDNCYINYLDCYFIIAIGNASIRQRINNSMYGVKWYTAIHPNAVISDVNVNIDYGTVVMPNAVINSCSSVGKHCIINTAAVIEHDNCIGDFSHISVGAKLAGGISVGEKSHIGIGAVIRECIAICDNVIVGAGAVVVKNINEPGKYIGVPAKKMM